MFDYESPSRQEDIRIKKAKLGSDDPRERATAASDLASYGRSAAAYEGIAGDVAKLLDDPEAEVRVVACNVLADMGEASAPFVDKVLALLSDGHLAARRMAITALGAIGSDKSDIADVGQALVKELRCEGETQVLVLHSLGAIGAEPYVNEVAELLNSQQLEVRRAALHCLGGLRQGTACDHAADIASCLDEPLVRAYAFPALVRTGQAAEQYVAEIIPFLEDGDHATRQAAVETLGALASHVDQDSVSRIAELLGHHNPAFRAAGAAALGSLGEQLAGEFAQAVKELLYDDEQWEVLEGPPALQVDMYGRPGSTQQLRGQLLTKPCCAAVVALGKLGSKGQGYVVELTKQFVWSSDPDFKIACMEALADMGETGAEYSSYIARCVKERGNPPHVRAAALLVLGDIVRRTNPSQSHSEWMAQERVNASLAVIAEALTDPDPDLQVYAVYAMGSAGPQAADYIPQLARIVEDRGSHLLATAVKALGDIGKSAAGHAKKVSDLLGDERMPVRHNAAEALGAMGAVHFADLISGHIRDPSCDVRAAAAVSLGRMGQMPNAVSIARLLFDPLSIVRRAACVGLGSLLKQAQGGLPRGLAEQLKAALDDDSACVREAALEAWNNMPPSQN